MAMHRGAGDGGETALGLSIKRRRYGTVTACNKLTGDEMMMGDGLSSCESSTITAPALSGV
jgi:hypothetical protein